MEIVQFDSSFLQFAPDLAPFIRAADVGYAVSQFLFQEGTARYPVSALTEAKVGRVRLDCGQKDDIDEDNLAIIFKMPALQGLFVFEIILRSDIETFYAGFARGGQLQIQDKFANGYRTLKCVNGNETSEYVFSEQSKRFELHD